jgi:putative membrane protein
MKKFAGVMVGLVALLHVGFLVLEMFLWQSEVGMKVFKMTADVAKETATLAMNQGLYNGFLAAGLGWSFFLKGDEKKSVRTFFLICIVVAGIFGAITAKGSILFIQALPAIIALYLVRKES